MTRDDAAPPIDLNDARPRRWGWLLLVLGLGSFAAWAALAPLDGGIPAPGTVVVSGNRKAVQSLVNGKIAALLAQDGDSVTSGQVLVRLDDTQARALLEMARTQWVSATAVQARLVAERLGTASVTYPPNLLLLSQDAHARAAMALQNALLRTRQRNLASELAAMQENIAGTEAQITGTAAARRAKQEQRELLQQELQGQRELAAEGLLARNRVSEQERALAALTGAIAEDLATMARARQNIAEVRARMVLRRDEVHKEIESQMTEVQKEAAAQAERIQALEFDLVSTTLRAPAAGIVLGLSVHTVGGVVTAGAPLMEVVPENEPLRVDAQVPPHLIDKLRPGLAVDILFPAFNQATTPHVPGRVATVSADALSDPRQNLSFFKVTVEVTPEGMDKLRRQQIKPGMPAEVLIRTGERTFWSYLFKPLSDRVRGALTEP